MKKHIIILALVCAMMLILCGSVSAADTNSTINTTPVPAYTNVYVQISNNVSFNYTGNNTYYIQQSGGGLNAVHIANNSSATTNTGGYTFTTNQSGTFYATDTGGRGYQDDVVLMLAVNGTIPDDFAVTITVNGYNWVPSGDQSTPPALSAISNYGTTLNETFTKSDFIYGPQNWRPSGYSSTYAYPIYLGEDMNDTSNMFYLMFIDLHAGLLGSGYPGGDSQFVNNGAVEINYSFNNLQSLAAFNIYAWNANTPWGAGMQWTNSINPAGTGGPSGYAVQGIPPVVMPVANFTANNTTGVAPLNVQFTDTSSNNPTSWSWDFDDGATSTSQNPTHIYSAPGNYTVTLTVGNSAGNNTITQTNYITVNYPVPAANFAANATSGLNPLTVQFTDTSTGNVTSWLWNFGDGTTSTQQNPTYTYATPGNYTVTLTVTGPGGNNTITETGLINVFNSTPPNVTATPDSGTYNSTQTVTLTSDQPGSTIYYTMDGSDPTDSNNNNRVPYSNPIPITNTTLFNFAAVNQGGVWSQRYSKNYIISTSIPSVTASPVGGIFNSTQTVTLTVNDADTNTTVYYTTDGSDPQTSSTRTVYTAPITVSTTTMLRYIAINQANNWSPEYTQNYTIVHVPAADFSANTTSGSAPLNVQFTDTSSNIPTSWLWNFGDGTTSTQENPTHTYTKPGTYTVTLTAANIAGNNTITKTNYITAIFSDAYVSPTGSDTTGDGTEANPYATIQSGLNNVVSGGTIHLAGGTYTGTGNKGLTITKNVNIVGSGQKTTIINAQKSSSIFTVNSGLNVTIANLTLANGTVANGGAISNSGTLTLNNCTFSTNTATSQGGAIYSTSTLNMTGCTFSSNTATTKGGAIYNTGTLNANNITFTGNMATSNHGGAIFNQGTLNVGNSTFTGNAASINGGAIMSQGTLNVRFSSFVNNTATSGSTIYSSSGTANAQNNWWGSNNNPSSQIYGTVNYTNWLYMTETVNPSTIANGSTGNVTVSFNNVYNGTVVSSIDPANGHIVDGTVVNFSSVLGSFNPAMAVTSNGIVTTTFTASDTHIRPINATTNNQTVSTYINGIGTTISVGNATCINGNTVNLTAILANVNGTGLSGQTVTFTVNGVNYTATTDGSGLATLNYTPSKAGVYNVTASFAGDSTYGDCSKTGSLTVQLSDAYVSPAGSDTTGDGTEANPYATIQTGLNCVVSGGTIHLAGGTYTGTGNRGLTVTRNVNIVGAGQTSTIINAQKSSSIFTVNSGLNVTIANLTLANGTTATGGAIYNSGTLNVSNCTFSGNNATNYGGAIYNVNTGNLTVSNCTFSGNTAIAGGAIFIQGTLNVTNCTFSDNIASANGGAFYIQGNVNVRFSSFVNNAVISGSGSAIYGSSGTVNAQNNWWGSNNNPSSQIYGTVNYTNWLYMTQTVNPTTIANGSTGNVTVSFNNVYNGTVVSSIDPANGHIVDGTAVNFSSVLGSFNPVTALTSNGIVTTTFTASDTHIRPINATTNNQTVLTYINGVGTTISVDNATCINGNTVNLTATLTSLNGTALSGQTVTFTVNGSSYNVTTDGSGVATLNYISNSAGVHSVIVSFDGDLTYGDCSKTGYLTVQTNDVYVSPTGSDITGDGTSTNPFATIQNGLNCVVVGGTIHLAGGTYTGTGNRGLTVTRNVNIVGAGQTSTIINAQKSSNIFTINSGLNVTIANLTFVNGTATNGGAISNAGNLNVSNCTFSGNNATSYGGAIYNYGSSSSVTLAVTDCTFTGNTATSTYGGAIYNYNGNITLSNSTFTNNTANTWGGAICNAWNGNLDITNSTFSNNTATNQGGAIANVGINAILNASNCTFSRNSATNHGGAIYNNGYTTVHFSSFVNNTAPVGSAINLAQNTVDAQNNWWGSNNNPSSQINGTVDYSNWLYMTIIINPTTIIKGSTGTATVSFNNFWNGSAVVSIDPASGHIVDGTVVNFSSLLGTFNPATAVTSNGIATAIFTAATLGSDVVNATTDNQVVSANVTVYVLPVADLRTGLTYSTIQAAINDSNTTNGDTITVNAGNYIENVILNKSLILNALGLVNITPLDSSLPVFTVTGDGSGSVIQGFTISRALNSSGISVSGDNVTIVNNTITDNSIGVLVRGNQSNIVGNNVTGNSWAGIVVDTSTNDTISNNTVSGNQEGIYLTNSSNNAIAGNQINNNTVNGLNIQNGSQNTITNNTITGNGVSANGSGVIIKNSAQNTLKNNSVQGNGWSGIALDGSSSNTIGGSNGGNTITGNDNGLVLYNGSNLNTIYGNTSNNSVYNGLELYLNCENNQISNNTIIGNQITGLLIQNSNSNNVTGNAVNNNTYNGVLLANSGQNTVDSNTINNNGAIGLLLTQSSNNTVNGNQLTGNVWTNIVLDQSALNQITQNTINGNNTSQQGILLTNGSNNNTVSSNTVENNTANGLNIQNSDSNQINGNVVAQNGIIGLLISNGNSNTLSGNTFQNSGWAGTCIVNSTNNAITQNNYINNPEQAYDNGTSIYDNGTTGNYYDDWIITGPKPIDGGSSVDNHPSTTPF